MRTLNRSHAKGSKGSGSQGPVFVTFSGIDGAGKSTQIELAIARLQQCGFRVDRFAYWDDAAVLKRLREDTMVKVFKGEKGIGSPEKPVRRNDKNVQRWYLTLGRCALFFLDAIRIRRVLAGTRKTYPDVIVFDRYCYDSLAALPIQNPLVRAYARALLNAAPRPDLAFVLDAVPEAAHERKPEYPVPFLHRYRQAYLQIASLAGMVVVSPGTPEEVHAGIWQALTVAIDSPSATPVTPEPIVGSASSASSASVKFSRS